MDVISNLCDKYRLGLLEINETYRFLIVKAGRYDILSLLDDIKEKKLTENIKLFYISDDKEYKIYKIFYKTNFLDKLLEEINNDNDIIEPPKKTNKQSITTPIEIILETNDFI